MRQNNSLNSVIEPSRNDAHFGIIKLLIADHDYMRRLMSIIKSENTSKDVIERTFRELTQMVAAHVKAEEKTFFRIIERHPNFGDEVLESYEEHRIHETVIDSIRTVKSRTRRIQQMKIFCEMLQHHIDDEEENIFPKFQRYSSNSIMQRPSRNYIEARKDPFEIHNEKGSLGYI